ncbi:tetratricopeptide repeat protein [Methyloterricola oryzae]|uniref:tetratricopeptide repeat protein n=1 Tax=Methyloterricola oryzae TaxID=1495050 RepID=UPI0005EB7EA3|nr:tetratricopeptide repeat protein [Methyloterricola oryzae]
MIKPILCLIAVTLLLTGCSRSFPEIPWLPKEQQRQRELQGNIDFASRLELARLYFQHNRIDEASEILDPLVSEQPNNQEAKAWHAANRCKLAERRGPWLLGIDKMVLLWSCMTELERAGHHAGDNLSVALAEIYTDTEVEVFGAKRRAYQAKDRLQQRIESKGEAYTTPEKAAFYQAAALLAFRHGDSAGARDYLKRVISLGDQESTERARQMLLTLDASGAG